jgi:hypothetical protein
MKSKPARPNLKHGNKPFWIDFHTGINYSAKHNERCEYFHSILEFDVYQHIIAVVDAKNVSRQHSIRIKPKTAVYPVIDWKTDFRVSFSQTEFLNIEVKGQWIRHSHADFQDFKRLLKFLEFMQPTEYHRLVIVSDVIFKIDENIMTITRSNLDSLLRSKLK